MERKRTLLACRHYLCFDEINVAKCTFAWPEDGEFVASLEAACANVQFGDSRFLIGNRAHIEVGLMAAGPAAAL